MATRTISTKLAIEGESEYKSAINNINTSLTTLNTKLNLTKSEFANHQNSMEALQAKSETLAQKQQTLSEKVTTCKNAYENAKTSLTNYQTRIDSLKTALANNEKALSSLSTETQKSGQQWAEYDTKVKDAEAKLQELQNTSGDTSREEEELNQVIAESKAKMAELESETGGAAKTAGELYEEQGRLTSELEKAEAGEQAASKACSQWEASENNAQIQLNKTNAEIELNDQYMKEAASSTDGCATSIDQFGNRVKQADSSTASMKESLKNLQNLMLTQVLTNAFKKLASALEDCIDASAEFESQMSTVEALSGATTSEMEELTAAAKKMGSTTSFTATEAGEALEYMALAGWSTDEMLSGLSGVMNLAAASGEDLGTTSDIVTDALTAFGYSASDASHFADVLAASSANSNTSVSQLGEAFQAVGTTAGTLGYSIDDVSVALGLMANNGLKGSTAGTSLATALTRMSGANETATKQMDEWNLSMFNADGTTKELSQFLLELRDAFDENCDSAEDAQLAAYNLAGMKGMKGLQAIVNSSDEDFDKLTNSINSCSGASQEMADIKLDNYTGQVTLMKSAFEGLEISIGDALTPALGNLAEMMTGVFSSMSAFIDQNPVVVEAVGALAAALGVAAAALVTARVAMMAFNAVMDTNAIVLVVTAIVGLTTAVAAFAAMAGDSTPSVKDLTEAARNLSTTMDESGTAIEESATSSVAAADAAEGYIDRLDELANMSVRTNEEELEYQSICRKLLQLMPEMSQYISETADEYGRVTYEVTGTKEAMLDLIEAEKNAAIVSAFNDALADEYAAYGDAVVELTSRQLDLAEATKESEAADDAYYSAVDRVNEALADAQVAADEEFYATGNLTDAYSMLSAEDKDLYNSLDELNQKRIEAADKEALLQEAVDVSTAALEEADAEITRQESALQSYTDTLEDTGDAQEDLASKYPAVTTAVEDLAEELISLQDAYDDAYDSAYESITGQFDLWEEAGDVSTKSMDELMSALQSQQDYWNELADNMEYLSSLSIDGMDDLLASIDTTTTDGAMLISSLADAARNDTNSIVDYIAEVGKTSEAEQRMASTSAEIYTQFSGSVSENIQACVDVLNDLDQSDEVKQYAYNTLLGYVSGLDEESDDVDEELKTVAQSAIDEFAEVYEMNSPSKVFERFGQYTLEGYIEGVDSEERDVNSSLTDVAKSAISSFQKVSSSDALRQTGSDTVSGYIKGTDGKSSTVNSSLQSLASNAISSFQRKSTSTSLTSTGQNTIQGYITGTNNKQSSATSKMQTIASNTITKFKNVATSTSLSGAGSNTIQGFINGLNNKTSSLYNKMTSIASNALSKFKKALGINSPSTEMMEAGQFTGEGFIVGIESMESEVTETMSALAEAASEAFNAELDYGDVDAVTDAYAASAAAPESDGGNMTIVLQQPIYVNGQYSREEIVEIALRGISRKQTETYAAKGVTA